MGRLLRAVGAAVLAAAAAGCRGPALTDAGDSREALARAVLDGVARSDARALRLLTIDEREFREIVWPELPASRKERNLPLEYVWTDLSAKSDAGLAQTLRRYGGRDYELVSVSFGRETSRYRSFLVHRETTLTVRDDEGAQSAIRLFGSTIERNGRFKVFSYVVD